MAIIHANKDNFEKEVLSSDKPVVVDFWAPWCGPCKMLGPVFEELSNEMDTVKFVKVNTEEEQQLAADFQIRGIPTISVIKGDKEINRFSGFMPKEMLRQKIEDILKQA